MMMRDDSPQEHGPRLAARARPLRKTFGADLGAIGNLTGTFIVNEPTAGSTTGARTIVTGTQAGTYTVNGDGTGVFTRVLTVNGVVTNQMDDFVITGAIVKDDHLVATAIVDAQG
jgi:hypothetical protein